MQRLKQVNISRLSVLGLALQRTVAFNVGVRSISFHVLGGDRTKNRNRFVDKLKKIATEAGRFRADFKFKEATALENGMWNLINLAATRHFGFKVEVIALYWERGWPTIWAKDLEPPTGRFSGRQCG